MKKRHWFSLSAIFVLICFLLTGCMGSRELTDIMPILGIGIDSAGNNLTKLTVQAAKMGGSKDQGSTKPNILIFEKTDKNAFDMLRETTHENSDKLFIGHNQCIIIGKDAASKGVKSELDLFLRDHEARMGVWILVSDSTANEILTAKEDNSSVSALEIKQMLSEQKENSESVDVNLLEFSSKLAGETTCPVASLIKIDKESGKPRLKIAGMAIFKKDRMVAELDENKTRGYLWTMNKIESGVVNVETKSRKACLEINASEGGFTPYLNADGSVSLFIHVKAELGVREMSGFEKEPAVTAAKELQKAAEEEIKSSVLACFQTTQFHKADIYGIGTEIYRKWPKKWREMQASWDKLYVQINPEITVQVDITDMGKISQS